MEPEDRERGRDLLEFRKQRILVHGYVRSRSRRSLEICLQDGGAPGGRNLLELNFLAAAAPNNGSAIGCSDVFDPLHVFSEHGHYITLSIHDDHDERQRKEPPRLSPVTSNATILEKRHRRHFRRYTRIHEFLGRGSALQETEGGGGMELDVHWVIELPAGSRECKLDSLFVRLET